MQVMVDSITVDAHHVKQEHMLCMQQLLVLVVLQGNIRLPRVKQPAIHAVHPLVKLATTLIAGVQMLEVVFSAQVGHIQLLVVHSVQPAPQYPVQLALIFIVHLHILQDVLHVQQVRTQLIRLYNAVHAHLEHTLQRDPHHAPTALQGHTL